MINYITIERSEKMRDIFAKEEDIIIKRGISSGANASVYKAIYNDQIMAYKEFKPGKILLNEDSERIITLANDYDKFPDNFVLPKYIINNSGETTSYLTELVKGKALCQLKMKSLKKKIEMLRKAKEVVSSLYDDYKIIHSELHLGNILYDGENIFIIDFDNCSYQKHEIGEHCNFLTERYIDMNSINKNVDTYIFNVATYAMLNNRSIYDCREYILDKDYGIFNGFPKGRQICDSIAQFEECDEYLIDTLNSVIIEEKPIQPNSIITRVLKRVI